MAYSEGKQLVKQNNKNKNELQQRKIINVYMKKLRLNCLDYEFLTMKYVYRIFKHEVCL